MPNPAPSPSPEGAAQAHTKKDARRNGDPPSSCQNQPQAHAKPSPKLMPKPDLNQPQAGVTADDAGHDLRDILAVDKAELVLDRVAGQLDRHAVLAARKDPHHVARPPVGQVLEF